ncbi:hypothetical protein cyc_03976 [Cyclospora cayetanensis]|uniref:Uncharacterized protein n=1 Tax=Cyclospora cayetanensis TaxID=88456 RepID=A0A1D3D4H7_9EIME|nr:hypothetical protein cyc_03976 [Cyclospora cayetanensis]
MLDAAMRDVVCYVLSEFQTACHEMRLQPVEGELRLHLPLGERRQQRQQLLLLQTSPKNAQAEHWGRVSCGDLVSVVGVAACRWERLKKDCRYVA